MKIFSIFANKKRWNQERILVVGAEGPALSKFKKK